MRIQNATSAVTGFTELIQLTDTNISPQSYKSLEYIKQNGQEILFIVDYLTTIVKVEFNKLALYPIPTDLSELLANITNQQMSQTEQQYIYKATALPKSVKADSKQLKITLELLHDLALNNKADSEKILFITEAAPLSNSNNWQIRFTMNAPHDRQLKEKWTDFDRSFGINRCLYKLIELFNSNLHIETDSKNRTSYWFEVILPEETAEHLELNV